MDYTAFLDTEVGYKLVPAFAGGEKKNILEPVKFREIVQPYLDGAETDALLYLRMKDDLGHIRTDKNHHLDTEFLNEDNLDIETLTKLDLEKRAIKNAMLIIRRQSEDSEKERWDDLTLETYLKGLEPGQEAGNGI
jgi:hypothetical protein